MARIRPIHAIVIISLFIALVLAADFAIENRFGQAGFTRVSPDPQGEVRIDVADLPKVEVRFYRFLNAGNQEVKFFVGRDAKGTIHVAFDASESDFKLKRGFRHQDGWITNNKCDNTSLLSEVNENKGGCRPVALNHTLLKNTVVIQERDILQGWRYFS